MDKKGIIAVTLSIIVMVVWQLKFAPKLTPPAKPQVAQTSPAPAASPAAPEASKPLPSQPETATAQTDGETQVAPEKTKITTAAVEYQFTNLGGGIAEASLLGHKADKNADIVLNSSSAIPIGAISERAGEGADMGYSMTTSASGEEVVFQRTTSNNLQITKKYTLPPKKTAEPNAEKKDRGASDYLVTLELSFKNLGAKTYRTDGYYVHVGSAAPLHPKDLPTYTTFNWFRDGKVHSTDVLWFDAGRIPLVGIETSSAKSSYTAESDKISWAAVKDQYFTSIISTGTLAPAKSVWARRLPIKKGDTDVFAIEGAMGLPGFSLAPGEDVRQQVKIYAGPKEYGNLRQLGNEEEALMKYEWGMFKVVSKFLLSSMNALNSWLGSYAAAILVLTVIIKLVMWPIQNRSTESMKKMQALQPKMAELKEKYQDDPARMNQEVMKLYKDYGVNPIGGCLPMFLQIPIFFGFYSMLGTAIELRNSQFLWVKDLSQPDTVGHLMGFPINVLPLLMAGTMLWQMSLTPKSGDATQQKIFMFMPLIFIAFCYNFASALALYWTVQNLFSIVQLYVTNKQTTPELKKIAVPKRKK